MGASRTKWGQLGGGEPSYLIATQGLKSSSPRIPRPVFLNPTDLAPVARPVSISLQQEAQGCLKCISMEQILSLIQYLTRSDGSLPSLIQGESYGAGPLRGVTIHKLFDSEVVRTSLA